MRVSHKRKLRSKQIKRNTYMVEYGSENDGVGWLVLAPTLSMALRQCKRDIHAGKHTHKSLDGCCRSKLQPSYVASLRLRKSNYGNPIFRYCF